MLTLTSRHALKALIYLVHRGDGGAAPSLQIAAKTDIPSKYLVTILSELTRAGVLESARGRGGGFWLAKPATEISLYEVVLPFEPTFVAKRRCPFGNAECDDTNPCLAHDEWKNILEAAEQFLRRQSLYDVAVKRQESFKHVTRKGTNLDLHMVS